MSKLKTISLKYTILQNLPRGQNPHFLEIQTWNIIKRLGPRNVFKDHNLSGQPDQLAAENIQIEDRYFNFLPEIQISLGRCAGRHASCRTA